MYEILAFSNLQLSNQVIRSNIDEHGTYRAKDTASEQVIRSNIDEVSYKQRRRHFGNELTKLSSFSPVNRGVLTSHPPRKPPGGYGDAGSDTKC